MTEVSRVTTWPPLTVAESPGPGTPAPPHVAAVLQLPLVALLNDVANSGDAAHNTTRNRPKRAIDLVMNPLSSEPGKRTSGTAHPFAAPLSPHSDRNPRIIRDHIK